MRVLKIQDQQRESELRSKLSELRAENDKIRSDIERFMIRIETECGSRDMNDPSVLMYLFGELLLTISTISSKMTSEEAVFTCALIFERSRAVRELVDLFARLEANNKAITELSKILGSV